MIHAFDSFCRLFKYKHSIVQMVFHLYYHSVDNWVVAILRFLYTFDFNITDYIFYLGYYWNSIYLSLECIQSL